MSGHDTAELAELRATVDALDVRLVELLAERGRAVRAVWAWKAAQGVERLDPARELAVRRRLLAHAQELGLDAAAVEDVLSAVVGKDLLRR